MKKLLLTAAIALAGLAAAPTAQAEFAPEANKTYYLRLNGTDHYLNLEQSRADGGSDNAAIITEKSPVVFFSNPDQTGQWAIRSAVTHNYIKHSTVNWTTSISSEVPYYWNISETEEGYLHIAKNNDANQNLGAQNGHPNHAFCDNPIGGSSANIDWILEEGGTEYIAPSFDTPVRIEAEKAFAIKHIDSGLYLDIHNLGFENSNGTFATIQATPQPCYFIVNPNNEFQYRIATSTEDGAQYVVADGWRALVNDGEYYWYLKNNTYDPNEYNFQILKPGDSVGLGAAIYASGNNVYSNKPDDGGATVYWTLVEYKEPRTVTVNMPGPDGQMQVSTMEVMDGDDVMSLIPFNPLFFATGVKGGNSIVSASNTEFEVEGTWMLNRAMRMKIRPVDEDKSYVTAHGNSLICNAKDNEGALAPERLWYFTYVNTDEDGHVHVTAHTFATPQGYGLTGLDARNSEVSLTEEPTEFYITINDAPQNTYNGFTLRRADSDIYVSNLAGNNKATMYKNDNAPRDYNSLFRVYPLTAEDYAATSWLFNGKEEVAIDADKMAAVVASNGAVEDVIALFGDKATTTYMVQNAADRYEELTGVAFTEGLVNVPGYVSCDNELVAALRTALVRGDGLAEALAAADGEYAPAATAWSYTPGALYNITYAAEASRNLCVSEEGVLNTAAYNGNYDASNANSQFGVIEINGKAYLYSESSGKLLNAFGAVTTIGWGEPMSHTDHTWVLSEVGTPISASFSEAEGAAAHSVTIQGGLAAKNPYEGNESNVGGISVLGKNTAEGAPEYAVAVLVSNGLVNANDCNAFIFKYAGKSTQSIESISAAVEAKHNEVEEAFNAVEIPAGITEDTHIVNHYTFGAISEYYAAVNHDHKQYWLENPAVQAPVEGTAYVLVSADDNQGWKVNDDGTYGLEEYDADKAAYYTWVLNTVIADEPAETPAEGGEEEGIEAQSEEIEAQTYTLTHTHDGNLITLNINGATEHTLGTEELGKVSIAGKSYVMTSAAGDGTTTAITEISVDSANSALFYDLSGRCVVNPSKGLYIQQQGSKVTKVIR